MQHVPLNITETTLERWAVILQGTQPAGGRAGGTNRAQGRNATCASECHRDNSGRWAVILRERNQLVAGLVVQIELKVLTPKLQAWLNVSDVKQ